MKKLLKILPLTLGSFQIRLLTHSDIDWYVKQVKSPFFNQYIDSDYSNIEEHIIKDKLKNILFHWKSADIKYFDVRTIIYDGEVRVGGLSLLHTDKSSVIELGYWIKPEFQRKGYGYKALNYITSEIEITTKRIKEIRLVIRKDNIASIKTAEKIGYKYTAHNKNNLIYSYTPLNFVR